MKWFNKEAKNEEANTNAENGEATEEKKGLSKGKKVALGIGAGLLALLVGGFAWSKGHNSGEDDDSEEFSDDSFTETSEEA